MKVIEKKDCEKWDMRYVIVDDNENVIDDAQGWGYKTKQKAYKAISYKYQGGREKKFAKKNACKLFFKCHPEIKKEIDILLETYLKEIAIKDMTLEDIKKEIDIKFNIDIPLEYLTMDIY